MMSISAEKTVGELALENPAATRVFEKLGIDYCCGGSQSLEEACRAANVPISEVVDSLKAAEQTVQVARPNRDWQKEPLADLIAHIKNTHHKYVRDELARLEPLFVEGLLGSREESFRIACHACDLSGSGRGADHAHDERREGPVPVHRSHGRIRHSERAGSAGSVRERTESGGDDDP